MKKRKPPRTNAKIRELQAMEAVLLKKHAAPLERGAKAKGVKVELKKVVYVTPPAPPSVDKAAEYRRKYMGVAAKHENTQYTGTAILGIGTMHKSSAVPIFSADEAEEIAHMRR